MKFSLLFILASALSLSTAYALEKTANKPDILLERGAANAVATSMTTALKSFMDPIVRCQGINRVYLPNSPKRDANGCVDPLADVNACHASNLDYNPPKAGSNPRGCYDPLARAKYCQSIGQGFQPPNSCVRLYSTPTVSTANVALGQRETYLYKTCTRRRFGVCTRHDNICKRTCDGSPGLTYSVNTTTNHVTVENRYCPPDSGEFRCSFQ